MGDTFRGEGGHTSALPAPSQVGGPDGERCPFPQQRHPELCLLGLAQEPQVGQGCMPLNMRSPVIFN